MSNYIHAIVDPGTGQVYYVDKPSKQMTCLTDKQLREIRSQINKSKFFERQSKGDYYYIDDMSSVMTACDSSSADDIRYKSANYFRDKTLAEQINMQQLFYRKLLRYAHRADLIDDNIWDGHAFHYFISCESLNKKEPLSCFTIGRTCNHKLPGVVYFKSEEAATTAITYCAEPFLREYPEFKECF